MSDLFCDFQNLKETSDADWYDALLVCNVGNHYLAKDENGSPIFLIYQNDTSLYQPDVKFKYFNVRFNIQCKVTHNNTPVEGFFCLVKFEEDYSDLYQMFIRSISANLLGFSKRLSIADIHSYIIQLGELFRFSSKPSVLEIIGLWAELYTISISQDTILAMKSWRSEKCSRFDFRSDDTVLEIKATLSNQRNHNFSLEQLNTPSKANGFVISFLLQKNNNGSGIIELAERIERSLLTNSELKSKLWKNIFEVLGGDFEPALDMCFNEIYARENVYGYALEKIPKPLIPDGHKITSVRFNVDISGVEHVKSDEILGYLY